MTHLFAVLLSFSILSNNSIELNTAGRMDLMTIPGIGPARADAILEHRSLFGSFFSLSELDYVQGIGAGTVESLSEYVYIDRAALPGPDSSHWLPVTDHLDPLITVCYLDVGQGDAILIQARDGMSMLFDGGPDGGGPLMPAVVMRLRELEVDTLHYLSFSHPHADHIGGLAEVVRNFTVLTVLDPGMVFTSWVYEDFLSAVLENGCDYRYLEEDMEIDLSPSVEVLVESLGEPGTDLDLNESSAILRVTCGNFSTVLTGDIEEDAQFRLAPEASPATVLKVPHHGSLSSVFPPYLRSLSPQIAVFSAGRGNPFGHPHPRVIEIYEELGCEILRTDTGGTIVVQSDGEALKYNTGTSSYWRTE